MAFAPHSQRTNPLGSRVTIAFHNLDQYSRRCLGWRRIARADSRFNNPAVSLEPVFRFEEVSRSYFFLTGRGNPKFKVRCSMFDVRCFFDSKADRCLPANSNSHRPLAGDYRRIWRTLLQPLGTGARSLVNL